MALSRVKIFYRCRMFSVLPLVLCLAFVEPVFSEIYAALIKIKTQWRLNFNNLRKFYFNDLWHEDP